MVVPLVQETEEYHRPTKRHFYDCTLTYGDWKSKLSRIFELLADVAYVNPTTIR